jgi:hypothetical protein
MTEKTGKQAGILVALGVASVGYSYVCATVPERVRGETSFRVVLGVAYTLGAVVALVALGGRKGELSGRHHFSPPSRMQQLLEQEGVVVENDQVRDFKSLLWDPSAALGDDWEP